MNFQRSLEQGASILCYNYRGSLRCQIPPTAARGKGLVKFLHTSCTNGIYVT